jgi:hypothetical protein
MGSGLYAVQCKYHISALIKWPEKVIVKIFKIHDVVRTNGLIYTQETSNFKDKLVDSLPPRKWFKHEGKKRKKKRKERDLILTLHQYKCIIPHHMGWAGPHPM